MPGTKHFSFRDNGPLRRRKPAFSTRPETSKRSIAEFARYGSRLCVTAGILGAAAFLLCQCHRQSSTPAPTPTATPASTAVPIPATTAPVTLTVTPTPTASPSASIAPTASSTPDTFEKGIKQLLQASGKGFLEFRGKFKRIENGLDPNPLFRIRKIYEGTFLFGGAASAELEEVYYSAGQQPAYNYHLYYQALSTRSSIERYDDLRLNLNRVLYGFEHTFGDRYDAWAGNDPLKTAILLSSQDVAGYLEIQVHVAFSSPQW
jgi:hypothetical protein